MKNQIDLQAKQTHAFNAGQTGRYLSIREASRDVQLKSDKLRPITLERGDTIDVSQFDDLEFYNPWDGSIFIEYQVSDVDIRIKSQTQTVGGVVEISRIQEGIKVDVPSVDVNFPNSINVGNFPEPTEVQKVQVQNLPDVQKVAINNFPEVQKVDVDFPEYQKVKIENDVILSGAVDTKTATKFNPLAPLSGLVSIPENPKRKELILIANDDNHKTSWIGGIEGEGLPLVAGASLVLSTSAEVAIYTTETDSVFCAEVES